MSFVCKYCNQVLTDDVDGCVGDYFVAGDGTKYERIRYGSAQDLFGEKSPESRCPDCGCKFGELHHYSCDVERCPRCGNQLLGCACDLDLLLTQ